MMEIEVSINRNEIARIGVHNTGQRVAYGTYKYNVYDLRGFDPDDNKHLTQYPKLCTVQHNEYDGASVLSRKVLAEVSRLDLGFDEK